MKGHRPKPLSFPEDPLIQSYMARHPEAKLVPISLSGDQPAPARAFAWRQLQLMQARPTGRDGECQAGFQPSPRQLQSCTVLAGLGLGWMSVPFPHEGLPWHLSRPSLIITLAMLTCRLASHAVCPSIAILCAKLSSPSCHAGIQPQAPALLQALLR